MVTALQDTSASAWRLDGQPLVVFGSFCRHDWEQLRQRQQELVERFAEKTRVYYVERHGARPLPPLKMIAAVLKRLTPAKNRPTAGDVDGVTFISIPLIPLHGSRPCDLLNAWLLERRLRDTVTTPLEECAAVTMYPSPYVLETVRRVPFTVHIHDSVQRYGESPQVYGRHAGRIDRELATLADVATCDSITIETDRREHGICALRMPQGFGRRFLEPPTRCDVRDEIDRMRDGSAVVGFLGALSDVIDLPLLSETARLLPDVRFVLAGPSFLDRPPSLPPNVSVFDWVAPEDVPGVMDAFDVGIVPYVLDRRTEAVLPTKLAEYMARGLRVVATPLPDIVDTARRFPSLIECAEGPRAFASAIDRRLALGQADDDEHSRVIEDLAWDTLFQRFVTDIERWLVDRDAENDQDPSKVEARTP